VCYTIVYSIDLINLNWKSHFAFLHYLLVFWGFRDWDMFNSFPNSLVYAFWGSILFKILKTLYLLKNLILKPWLIFHIISDSTFILANAKIVDHPIVYVSETFSKLTGFNRTEVMQKSSRCAFLHGEDTNKDFIEQWCSALINYENVQFELQLYKKNSKINLKYK